MNKAVQLTPEFVEAIPSKIEQGKIYISMEFATAIHSCCCGCGNEVVTPFTPTDWKLIFDGVSISLSPSIGNWSFPCQSHYWIRNNQIKWTDAWSQEQIATGRANDNLNKRQQYGEATENSNYSNSDKEKSFWLRLLVWIRK